MHNPLFSRTAADGHTTSPSLGSSIRIKELTLIFFTTIAPSSPPQWARSRCFPSPLRRGPCRSWFQLRALHLSHLNSKYHQWRSQGCGGLLSRGQISLCTWSSLPDQEANAPSREQGSSIPALLRQVHGFLSLYISLPLHLILESAETWPKFKRLHFRLGLDQVAPLWAQFVHNRSLILSWWSRTQADLQRDKTENLPQTRSWMHRGRLLSTKVSWLFVVWTFSRSLESLNTSESHSRAWLKPTPKASLQGQLVFPWSAGTAPCPACAATDDTRLGLPMVGELWPAGAGYGHLNGYAISHCTPGCGALSLVQITLSGCLIHPCLKGMPQCALTDSCTQILVTYHRLWEAHRICRLDKCNPGKVN